MLGVAALLLFVSLNAGLSHGMECTLGQKDILDKILGPCPTIFNSPDKSYCCYDLKNNKSYCCDAAEFGRISWTIITVVIGIVAIIVSLILLCVSCLCCSCCPWYRSRHRGMIYGRVAGPRVVHVIQPSVDVPQPTPFYTSASNPTNSTETAQPPPYTAVSNGMYAKQPL